MELRLDTERMLIVPVGDASINVRILSVDETIKIRKKYVKMKNTRSGWNEEFDRIGYAKDFWDRTIVSWTGFSQDGAAIECTRDNKYALVSQYDEIACTINEAIEAQKDNTLESRAKDLKN
jgi:hypothetical protein